MQGYQKFLLTHEGRKYPIRVDQLANLRRFNEELRTALGVPTYYNEAIDNLPVQRVRSCEGPRRRRAR